MVKYQQPPMNARALCQAMSWLKAVGIKYSPGPQDGGDLVLATKAGGEIQVKLAMTKDEPRPARECLVVLAKELASPQAPVALRAFHAITEAAGYGSPLPVDRGVEPDYKLHYNDNFELVSFRHKDFRRVPNPDPAELAQYKRVLEQSCYRFVNMNQEMCRRNCLLVEDLMTYAQVWTCNYLGLHKVAVETVNDNVRKLRCFLKQRFAEFAHMIQKKERNCFPAPDTVQIAILGKPIDENHRLEGWSVDPMSDEAIAHRRKLMEDKELVNDEALRRAAAQEYLSSHFGAMPHEKMVEVLKAAMNNTSFCHDARIEARKQLTFHQKHCVVCSGVVSANSILPSQRIPLAPVWRGLGCRRERPGQMNDIFAGFWATLPDLLWCPKHNEGKGGMVPKSEFRPLVSSKKKEGVTVRLRHTSYCVPCFREYSRNLKKKTT